MLHMRTVSARSIDRKKYLLLSNLWTVRVIQAILWCAHCERWSSPLVVAPYPPGHFKAAFNVVAAEERVLATEAEPNGAVRASKPLLHASSPGRPDPTSRPGTNLLLPPPPYRRPGELSRA
jgi:hypothetical protein